MVQLPVHCSGSCRRCQLKFWFFKQHRWHWFIFPCFVALSVVSSDELKPPQRKVKRYKIILNKYTESKAAMKVMRFQLQLQQKSKQSALLICSHIRDERLRIWSYIWNFILFSCCDTGLRSLVIIQEMEVLYHWIAFSVCFLISVWKEDYTSQPRLDLYFSLCYSSLPESWDHKHGKSHFWRQKFAVNRFLLSFLNT